MPSSVETIDLTRVIDAMRAAQAKWHAVGLRQRLRALERLTGLVAEHAEDLVSDVVRPVPVPRAEILASEVLPLAEACRYVVRRGRQTLAPVRLPGRDGAWWMGSIRVWETREPLGIVLLIGPSNYPLLLPGVQLVQALAAGNGVLIKPAPGCADVMERLVELCWQAGVLPDLVHVLPTEPEAAAAAIDAGVDKVFLTGSRETGRTVARLLADTLTPAALELSGNDAVFVLDDADLNRVASSVAYALLLNGSQTCIAPRRLFATAATLQQLIPLLRREIERYGIHSRQACSTATASGTRPSTHLQHVREAVEDALSGGAELVYGDLASWDSDFDASEASSAPVVLAHVQPLMRVATEDCFAPVLSLIESSDMDAAIDDSRLSHYALGGSVFGSADRAARFAARVHAGCVTVNDVLVPTADPRVSFGGWDASGYGVTRGPQGLREMTRLKVVCQRRGRWLPHLSTDSSQAETLMLGLLRLRHGGSLAERWHGCKLLMESMKTRHRHGTKAPEQHGKAND